MSGDYSRKRFDPRADFAAVLMQQGRVQLDSDWNELVEIFERRLRAETVDLMSDGQHHPGVAFVPRETPDGFKIEASGGALTIGRGRMYVDGLLAENHGAGAPEFDAVLAETRGQSPLAFDKQPYHPAPQSVPTGGSHLAYLDVWQREVTHLERPGIVEPALNVDTTTRLQTVWQVRLLANVGSTTCATPDASIPGWSALIAPSAGRLSSTAIGVKPQDDPCDLPPSGGYRGLENQLYRVEIHVGGAIGQATFKWSRDNASVASAVVEIVSPTQLKLASFGRDAVLRINSGDWVEIIDDARELSGEGSDPSQRRGALRKITVDENKGTVSFAPALPADLIAGGTSAALKRHLRLRRWDHKGKVRDDQDNVLFDLDAPASAGAIKLPATGTPIMLEHGVQITFSVSPAGGEFRTGDYWVFAARTADASVEELDQAPPQGIHHHYARLAMVTLPDAETDCRRLWPPESAGEGCDCTVCVTPEAHASGALTIQKAIDEVKASGGTVCLAAGFYMLGATPLNFEGAHSVRLKGQGWRTLLVSTGAAARIEGCAGITLEDLALISLGREGQPIISATNVLILRLQRLTLLGFAGRSASAPAIGLGGVLFQTDIIDNFVIAPVGIAAAPDRRSEKLPLVSVDLRIENNNLWCQRSAVSLDRHCIHLAGTRVSGNDVLGCGEVAIRLTGAVVPGAGVDVSRNALSVVGDAIEIGVDGAHVGGNDISASGGSARNGILLVPGLDQGGLDRCQILNNRVVGLSGIGVAVRTSIKSAMIKGNIIEGTAEGIVFEDRGAADTISIENNQLLDIGAGSNDTKLAPVGIRVVNARSADIVGNTVRGLGIAAVQALARVGIQAIACAEVRVAGNQLTDIGPPAEFVKQTTGIEIVRPFERVDVNDNIVRRHSSFNAATTPMLWLAISIQAPDQVRFLRLSRGVTTIPVDGTNHLMITGAWAFVAMLGAEMVAVRGNLAEAHSILPLIRIAGRGDCTLTDNRCLRHSPSDNPTVRVAASTLIANANRATGGDVSMAFDVEPNRLTVVGNITTNRVLVKGNPLSAPWSALNVIA